MMIPEGLPFCHGAKIPIACDSALAQKADFAIPPFDYHHGANAGATTGGILFHTFEGGVNCGALTSVSSASSHKWEAYRRRRFGRFSRRRATSILRSVRKERATQKIGQSAIGPPGWLEKGPSAIQTLLKPTVCLALMRRCTR